MTIARYNDIVIETQGDTSFEITTTFTGKTKIKIKGAQYTTPIIPNGYKYVKGHWYNGFVIERISDKSRFVWIPVGYLNNDGTLDGGKTFTSKFGRRNYSWSTPRDSLDFKEVLDDEFKAQSESIEEHGGFYISQYLICSHHESYLSHWTDVSKEYRICYCKYKDAFKIASLVENSKKVKSHLIYASEYDSMMAWLVKSQRVTLEQITEFNPCCEMIATDGGFVYSNSITAIGGWHLNNIYDIKQVEREWTQEVFKNQYHVSRGGSSQSSEAIFGRNIEISQPKWNQRTSICGFRVALWLE